MKDKVQKNRQARGETDGNSRLQEGQVLSIRASYARGEANQYEMARQFGVHQATISNIVLHKTWKHL